MLSLICLILVFGYSTDQWSISSSWRAVGMLNQGDMIIACSDDYRLSVWNINTGKEKPIPGFPKESAHFIVSKNGRILINFFQGTSVVDLQQRVVIRKFNYTTNKKACLSVDGKLLALPSNLGNSPKEGSIVDLVEPQSGKQKRLFFPGKLASCAQFNEKGDKIAIGFGDSSIVIMKTESQEVLAQLAHGHRGEITALAFSSDEIDLISGSEDETIAIWDVVRKKVTRLIQNHKGTITSIVFSKKHKSWFTLSTLTAPIQWKEKSFEVLKTYERKCSGGYHLAISNNEETFVINSDSLIRAFDISTGMELGSLKPPQKTND